MVELYYFFTFQWPVDGGMAVRNVTGTVEVAEGTKRRTAVNIAITDAIERLDLRAQPNITFMSVERNEL